MIRQAKSAADADGWMPSAVPRLMISSQRATLILGPPSIRPYILQSARTRIPSAASTASCHSAGVLGSSGLGSRFLGIVLRFESAQFHEFPQQCDAVALL